MKYGLLYVLFGVAVVTSSTVLIWPQLSLFLASDSCLASGGSFDFSQLHCDFQRSHPYSTFKLWPFWTAFAGATLGVILAGRGLLQLRPDNSFKRKSLRG